MSISPRRIALAALTLAAASACKGEAQLNPVVNLAREHLIVDRISSPLDESPGNRGQIRLNRLSRVSVHVQVERGLSERLQLPSRTLRSLAKSITGSISPLLRRRDMNAGIFSVNESVPENQNNVAINLVLDRGRGPGSYRLRLTARQGRSRWLAAVSRIDGVNPSYQGMADEDGSATDNRVYKSLLIDARELSGKLANSIALGT